MRNGRPARTTSASPVRSISSRRGMCASTCAGSDGAAMVATPPASGMLARRGEHGGAAEAVADQDLRGAIAAAQEVGGGDEVGDVGGEIRVGEVPAAARRGR